MGTTLIFVGLVVCDGSPVVFFLNGLEGRSKRFQEIAPAYRPYPKPDDLPMARMKVR